MYATVKRRLARRSRYAMRLRFAQKITALLRDNVAAGYGIIGRAWLVLTGPLTFLLLASEWSPVVQGFFFTFVSLMAVRFLTEFGLGQVIIVQVARASANVSDTRESIPPRVGAITRFCAKWFAGAGLLIGAGLGTMGTMFLASKTGALPQDHWLLPWITVCALLVLDVPISALLFPLEGLGHIEQVYFCRMVRNIINTVSLWIAIALDFELWALAFALGASILWMIIFFGTNGREILGVFRPSFPCTPIMWRSDIFPAQWQLGISSLTDYFMFYSFAPVIYYLNGPVAAGQIGLTWQLAASLSAISGVVVSAKFRESSRLIALKDYGGLDKLTIRAGATSLFICMLGAVAAAVGVLVANAYHFSIASRMMPFDNIVVLLIGIMIWHASLPFVSYLRAHGGDPFFLANIGGACLMLICDVTLGRWFGAAGLVWGFTLIGALYVLPAALLLFHRLRFKRALFELGPRAM